MANLQDGDTRSLKTAEDLSGGLYLFGKLDSNKDVVACDAITDKAEGVIQVAPDAEVGSPVVIKVSNQTKVVAKEALAIGAYVAPSTDSKAQVAVSTQLVRGIVVGPAAAEDDIAVIELFRTAVAVA